MTKQKNVRWKCPECGNHHSWYWSKYDVFPGEITMNCDNPKCEAQSKMMMTLDKKGNATAVVYKEDKELEDKLRRATEKVMNSQTEINTINLKNYTDKKVVVYHRNLKKVEGYVKYNNQFPDYPYKFNDRCYTKNGKILIDNENGWDICRIFPTTEEIDPSRILKDNDFIWYMGEKYQKVEISQTLSDKLETWIEYGNFSQSKDVLVNEVLNMVKEFIPEPMVCDDEDYDAGWNDAIRKMEGKLK